MGAHSPQPTSRTTGAFAGEALSFSLPQTRSLSGSARPSKHLFFLFAAVLGVALVLLFARCGAHSGGTVITQSGQLQPPRLDSAAILDALPDLPSVRCSVESSGCVAHQVHVLRRALALAAEEPEAYWRTWASPFGTLQPPLYRAWEFVEHVPRPRDYGKRTKWIVLTSINEPTPAIAEWTKLPDWTVVVVGDAKSPRDWHHEGVVFLSVEDQMALPFRLAKAMPLKNYGRKAIGYLYAVWHGAEIIYETDDDNAPKPGMELSWIRPERVARQEARRMAPGTSNIYSHFGQCSIWPRGWPLDGVMKHGTNHCHQMEYQDDASGEESLHVPIQQGLADLDPDVDAIWRLARTSEVGSVRFDDSALPLVVGRAAVSPFNTQNTVHYKSAFWAMFVPAFVNMRVCDIWRSYFSQRLLWELGAGVLFVGGTVDQVRSPHVYEVDFVDELQMYVQAGALAEFLARWRCAHGHLFDCALQLAHDLSLAGYWPAGDAELLQTWVLDLASLGYQPPPLVGRAR